MSQNHSLKRSLFLSIPARLVLVLALLLAAVGAMPAATASATPASHAETVPPAGLTAGEWTSIREQIRQAEYYLTWHEPGAAQVAPNRAHGWHIAFGATGAAVTPRLPSPSQGRPALSVAEGPALPVPRSPLSLSKGVVEGSIVEGPALSVAEGGQGGDGGRHWNLSLTGYGYEGEVQPMDPTPTQSVDGNRIEYRYEWANQRISEWYVNDERGLEQGFTLQSPPLSQSPPPLVSLSPGLLVLEMALHTTLTPHLADEGQTILFRDETGRTILRYADLHVSDATGKALPAHMDLIKPTDESRIPNHVSRFTFHVLRISIDATNATYPLTIDPLFTSQVAKLTASDGAAYDYFGNSVAISGDTVVVGAYGDDDNGSDSGSAYVFERNQTGADLWGQVAKLTASDAAADDCFGRSVAISGDTVVVGADYDDDNGTKSGSAYVFERNQTGADNWGQVAKLTASDGAAEDYFGYPVAISGDTVVVGARWDDDNGSASGSAYVYQLTQSQPDLDIAYLPLVVRNYTPLATFPLLVGGAIPERPVIHQGEVFYTMSVRLPDELPPGGHFYFSSQRDAVAEVMVDDLLVILLDGVEVFAYDFSTSGHPEPTILEVPRSTMEQLVGQTITIEY